MKNSANGISLHIGLNLVDPAHYNGKDGKLVACESDATDMESIAQDQGFDTQKLLSVSAKRQTVINVIKKAASKLEKGDVFFLTYSGHGGRLPDRNSDEADGTDETWCLYDGQLIDDELSSLWASFASGVRILVLSDSCHSGTVVKGQGANDLDVRIPRFMPDEVSLSTYQNNKSFYDKIMEFLFGEDPSKIAATVKLISGCQDNQFSYDGTFNGQFTGKLKQVWNGGKFRGNYEDFHQSIVNLMPSDQTPNLLTIGTSNENFDNEQPFTI